MIIVTFEFWRYPGILRYGFRDILRYHFPKKSSNKNLVVNKAPLKRFVNEFDMILLMDEILHHQG